MATNARDYVLAADSNEAEAAQIALSTAQGTCITHTRTIQILTRAALESKQLNLIQVVESVGEYINHEDATIRSKAVRYLSASLAALPADFLSRQQLMVLAEFFSARMQDGSCLGALVHLQGLKRFNNEMAVITVKA